MIIKATPNKKKIYWNQTSIAHEYIEEKKNESTIRYDATHHKQSFFERGISTWKNEEKEKNRTLPH